MSIAFNGSSQYLSRTGQLGTITQDAAQSWGGWFKTSVTTTGQLWSVLAGDGATIQHGAQPFTANVLRGWYNYSRGNDLGSIDTSWMYVCQYKANSVGNCNTAIAHNGNGWASDAVFAVEAFASDGGTAAMGILEIGRAGSNGIYFTGEACCFRVWSSQLTLAQFRQEAVSTSPVNTTGLLANWRLASATDLTDSTVNAYVLTANGSPTNGASEPSDLSAPASPALMGQAIF